jgi:hypothetical protein
MNQIKEIAKSIYDEIQVVIEEKKKWYSYLIFKFKDGEFIEYFFSDDLYYSNDDTVYGGFVLEEYTNISIEDIEEELLYAQSNQCDKNKFDKLVELAKESAERETLKLAERFKIASLPISFIPKNGCELLLVLYEWHNSIMLAAGYSQETIERNMRDGYNYEYYKLANAIDDWYKTKIYPKIYEAYSKAKV